VEAGSLARCGFNSAGVAITANFLKSENDAGREGVPVPLVRRAVLEATTLYHAMERVLRAPRSHSINVMLSHESGEAINFETTPREVFWVKAVDGLLVHSNHFVSPGALAKLVDVGLAVTPDSLYRDTRVRARLEHNRGRISGADFKEAFGDSFGSPYSVCRRPSEGGPGGGQVSTVASIIMDVTARKAWIAPTPYKEGSRYWEYDLESPAPRLRDPG
jgi:isopenicillin-N N-acyltransferase-like protein